MCKPFNHMKVSECCLLLLANTYTLKVMASGMTYSTAEHKVSKCKGSFREDIAQLRPGGPCSYVPQPGFGMVEVDWAQRIVSLSVRNHTSGGVADGYDGSKQLVRFSLDTCQQL